MDYSSKEFDRPPSYRDSHRDSTGVEATSNDIFADHRRAQEERIRRLLSLYVDPLLKNHASSGIAKAVFVLVPSDSTTLQSLDASQADVIDKSGVPGSNSTSSNDEVLTSFRDEDNVRLVRLHGEENSWAFWRQPSVVRELELEVRARYKIPESQPKPAVMEQTQQPASPSSEKRRWFGRKTSNKPSGSGMFNAGGGWSLSEEQKPDWGQVALQIKIEEVSLRTITKIGLFDTRSGQALVVKIHIGS